MPDHVVQTDAEPRPVAVLLHGFAGAPATWAWLQRAWPPPAPHFVVPDLPGHGRSPEAPCGGFDAALATLAGQLPDGADDVHLVGYSLGARLALGLASREPERFTRLSLIGVNPGIDESDRASRRERDERWAQRLESDGLDAFLTHWEAQPLFHTQTRLPAIVREAQRAWRRNLDPGALADAMRQMSLADMPDYRPQLDRLALPVQLIVGERDAKFTAIAQKMRSRLVDARLDLVPGVGHNVPLEAPALLARHLADFARQPPSA